MELSHQKIQSNTLVLTQERGLLLRKSVFIQIPFSKVSDKSIKSILVWAVTKDAAPVLTTLSVTFHCLILCSNLGNCLDHRELIPVMQLPPPSQSRIGPMPRNTGPDSPWIPAKPNDFQVPRPLLVSVCLNSQNGPIFCLHTHFSCQIVAVSFLYSQMMSKGSFA